MKIYPLQNILEEHIYAACVDYIALIKPDLNGEKISVFNIHSCNGYSEGIGAAVSTKESFLKRTREQKIDGFQMPNVYLEVCVDEWDFIGLHYEAFRKASDILIALYNTLYDGCEFEDETDYQKAEDHINSLFPKTVINVLNKLKEDGTFNNELFEDDIFLGYQFSDSGNEQIAQYVQASKQLNSVAWHKKILDYQAYCISLAD